jgi:uncharacterized RDD family membrane protein YckC
MPMTAAAYSSRHPGLPDPVREAHFYSGVTMKRGLAWVIDVVLILGLSLVILPFTAFTAVFFFPLFWLVVGFFYRWATIASRSSTWGMRIMAIELREQDGLRLSGGTALLHTIGYTVSVAMAPLQLISVILMIVSGRGQGLSDMILGTAAINRPVR